MATKRFSLKSTEWTEIGAAPCSIQTVPLAQTGQAGEVLFVVDTSPPASIEAAAHVLSAYSRSTVFVGLADQRIYAKSGDSRGAVVAVSSGAAAASGSTSNFYNTMFFGGAM